MLLDLFSKIYSVAMSRRSHCMANSSCLFINSFARSLCASLSSETGHVSSTFFKIWRLSILYSCLVSYKLRNGLIKFLVCERLMYLFDIGNNKQTNIIVYNIHNVCFIVSPSLYYICYREKGGNIRRILILGTVRLWLMIKCTEDNRHAHQT